MKKRKPDVTAIILVAVLVVGLSLLLYPTLSDYWNSLHQTRAIVTYTQEVAKMDTQQYDTMLQEARDYNQSLTERISGFMLGEEQQAIYTSMLNVAGDGAMGYVEIPSISCTLPIYHGTDEAVLQVAVGHLEWSSLPVGGESTHCVLSGHRGLPSAKLFTNLDKLVVGDQFLLKVLDEVLTYEVDQILIVEPEETQALAIEQGKDLCTLVTCTPYGLNTHRLLVRGHRVETEQAAPVIHVSADAIQLEPMTVAPVLAIPPLIVVLIWLAIPTKRRNPRGGAKS